MAAAVNVAVELPLHRTDGSIGAYTLVDLVDAAWATKRRWYMTSNGYVRGNLNGRKVALHRVILGLVPGDRMDTDHRNGNRLDNRRGNLRRTTRAENSQNLEARRGRYRGVSWDRRARSWRASVTFQGVRHYLGRFKSEEEAARIAADFRREHMPFSERSERT
jgi:hypothetical protein